MQAELNRLRKENKRLKMEREILKKAAAFFAKKNELKYQFVDAEKKGVPSGSNMYCHVNLPKWVLRLA